MAQYALQLWNREIERELGVANVLTTVREASIEAAEQIFHHPKVALICVTGGAAVAKAAAKSGKRVIAGGPGNPPVVVDETADLDHAARCIIEGAAFDNNLLCIGEKEIFVVASVADAFIQAMRRAGAFQLDSAAIDRLTKAAFTFEGGGGGCARAHVKKDLVGKDAAVLAIAAGVRAPSGTDLLFGETDENHPFVVEEQMMPFVPVVRVRDVDAGIAASVKAEHGYRHTALIHTQNVDDSHPHGARDEHHSVHPERSFSCIPGSRRPGILQSQHRDSRPARELPLRSPSRANGRWSSEAPCGSSNHVPRSDRWHRSCGR